MRILTDPRIGGALRTQYAELPSHLVLPRGCSIGVEQVALIEHRIRHGANPIQIDPTRSHRLRAHGSPTRSALSSRSTTESHVVRPCSALYRVSSVRTSRLSRSQPLPGKCWSIHSRQTATGIR